jgi:serine/threonine protein kinase
MNTPFGRYELIERIAIGGMAEVFRARTVGASGFEKEIVIKRILPRFSEDEVFVKMFSDEARIVAKLHHPNIVQVFDFDVVDGLYFIAMELVEGSDLRTLLKRARVFQERLSVGEAMYIVMEVAKGLDYAHRREHHGEPLRIVHRDVSPHNVMVSYDGSVKLTDFGIAKAAARSSHTEAGVVKGKLAYMSPEQARGETVDHRSDLFSLGSIFYELLTLRRLFQARSNREIVRLVQEARVPAPSRFGVRLPGEVEAILKKMLAKFPDQRYASVGKALRELDRAYHRLGVDAVEQTLQQRMKRLFGERVPSELELTEETYGLSARTSDQPVISKAEPMDLVPAGFVKTEGEEATELRLLAPVGQKMKFLSGDRAKISAAIFEDETQLYSPSQPARSRIGLKVVMTLLGLAVVVVIVGVMLGPFGDRGETDLRSGDPTFVEEATIIIRSTPEGATVRADDVELPGRTPLTYRVSVGQSISFSIELEGHRSEQFEVSVNPGEASTERSVTLRPE